MERYKVSYSVKRVDDKSYGLLVDYSKTFSSFGEAINFIKQLRTKSDLIGSPMMESV